jgi:hypothetical protein
MRDLNNYKQILNEAVVKTIPAPQGSVALRHIDITDPDDPSIAISGWGSMKMSTARKDIANRLNDLAKRASVSGDFEAVHAQLTNPKMPTAFILIACVEAEKLLATPSAKAKLTLAKKAKRGL